MSQKQRVALSRFPNQWMSSVMKKQEKLIYQSKGAAAAFSVNRSRVTFEKRKVDDGSTRTSQFQLANTISGQLPASRSYQRRSLAVEQSLPTNQI